MAGTNTLKESSNVTIALRCDVFLSFNGEDTGKSFTDHLYKALVREGVSTFRDEKLKKGQEIQRGLWEAIEESRLSIIVFSENYASSKWCLDELVKIMETRRTLKQIVVPVFYDVNPSDVREQKGRFGQRFAGLLSKRSWVRTFVDAVNSFGRDLYFGAGLVLGEAWRLEKPKESGEMEKVKVDRWKAALTEAGNLAGWHLENSPESEVIEKIVKDILEQLFEDLSNSRQRQIKLRSKILNNMNMKFLHLRHTYHLIDTPALPGITSPEKLLNDCTSLVEVHQYVACLDKQDLSAAGEFRILCPGIEVPNYFKSQNGGTHLSCAASLLPDRILCR